MATPLVYPLMDACRIGGFGHTRCYELIAAGILDARKAGSRTVITHESLAAYAASLPKLELGDQARDTLAAKRRPDR